MKELAPPAVNLQKLFERDTHASEPILIMISPGADPSQELEELAKVTVGYEKYHQVSYLFHDSVVCQSQPSCFSLETTIK